MDSTKYVTDLHAEHGKWLEALTFYNDEMQSFGRLLEDVVKRNTVKETVVDVEHFQNQFICQKEVLDILRHDIKLQESQMMDKISLNPIATDHKRALDEPDLRDRMEIFEKIFTDLKNEFKQFLAKSM